MILTLAEVHKESKAFGQTLVQFSIDHDENVFDQALQSKNDIWRICIHGS